MSLLLKKGRHEPGELIGKGSFGQVYAIEYGSRKDAVIKKPNDGCMNQEIDIHIKASACRPDIVVQVLKYKKSEPDSNDGFLIMPRATSDLAKMPLDDIKKNFVNLILFSRELLYGLQTLDVLHTDITARNILFFKKQQRFKIADFGLAEYATKSSTDWDACYWRTSRSQCGYRKDAKDDICAVLIVILEVAHRIMRNLNHHPHCWKKTEVNGHCFEVLAFDLFDCLLSMIKQSTPWHMFLKTCLEIVKDLQQDPNQSTDVTVDNTIAMIDHHLVKLDV